MKKPHGFQGSETLETISLLTMLENQALKHPNSVAIVDDNKSVSFNELHTKATILANSIMSFFATHDKEIKSEKCVGLYMEASVDLVESVWGILFSGNAYLPISPDYPSERVSYIVEKSNVRVIVTQRHLLEKIQAIVPTNTQFLVLNDFVGEQKESCQASQVKGSELAYVIFTSGSTGKPKGVLIEHHSIANQMAWLAAQKYLAPGERILQKTPISFDAAQWEILAPAVGATVVVGEPGLFRDVFALIDRVNRFKVTKLQCVPTLLHALVKEEKFIECTSLTTVFSGGEALSQKLASQFLNKLPNCELINMYGPTECTINATWNPVRIKESKHDDKNVPIGKPVVGCTCYILDNEQHLVSHGVEGELYIGGEQLARGYLNDPEQTAQRFITAPFISGKLYKTGDRCVMNQDGRLTFVGRTDNQVKLRGYRVELEEISTVIEKHSWVKQAVAVVTKDKRHGGQILNACIELDEHEAALMDQGLDVAHHQSKSEKIQVKKQLSNPGLRAFLESDTQLIELLDPEPEALRKTIFSRKTYRSFEGGELDLQELKSMLMSTWFNPRNVIKMSDAKTIDFPTLSSILRWMSCFNSDERILPKYAYASPGALYATQLYIETMGVIGLKDGLYYYNPVKHALLHVSYSELNQSGIRFHLIGKTSAIEPVYKHNIQEVLEIEAGHMLAVIHEALLPLGYSANPKTSEPIDKVPLRFGVAPDDYYLGVFDCVAASISWKPMVDLYIQSLGRGVKGLGRGSFCASKKGLMQISTKQIEARHVIAINQPVFHQASVGISVVSKEKNSKLSYISLGYVLHVFQRNTFNMGFMSSGYSSKTGHTLPALYQLQSILSETGANAETGYFFIGGKVSCQQELSQGMQEDSIHMLGPAEILKEDLKRALPEYMIPNRVFIFHQLPHTANGKIDRNALEKSEILNDSRSDIPFIAPLTETELWLAELWEQLLNYSPISSEDDFFSLGGNSLLAVITLQKINKAFDISLPIQFLFKTPKLKDLAARIDLSFKKILELENSINSERFIPLAQYVASRPIFCWPGLGGYPMNLRKLAQGLKLNRTFFGIQSHGLNKGELPYDSISSMAQADVEMILKMQPVGPITLWGYSFGARPAFEAAWQLEQTGHIVDQLVLICPGNPNICAHVHQSLTRSSSLKDRTFVTILLSVFLGRLDFNEVQRFFEGNDLTDAGFVHFIVGLQLGLEPETVNRIMNVVMNTYEFEFGFTELSNRRLNANITIIKASGDDYSFIENANDISMVPTRIVHLNHNHYDVLNKGVPDLIDAVSKMPIADALSKNLPTGVNMPHIDINCYPIDLDQEEKNKLSQEVTHLICKYFGVTEDVVSIGISSVQPNDWVKKVYVPKIKDMNLIKAPKYEINENGEFR